MSTPALEMNIDVLEVRTRVNESGRLVLPKELRTALGIESGDVLFFSKNGETVRLETQKQRMRRAQEHVCSIIPPGVSLVDELIAERREEFRREMEE